MIRPIAPPLLISATLCTLSAKGSLIPYTKALRKGWENSFHPEEFSVGPLT